MANKKQKRYDKLITGLIIAIIIWGIYHILSFQTFKFDPEKDVCIECKTSCPNNYIGYEMSEEGCAENLKLDNTDCTEWRPKTKCELDPEAEWCVCDEYETKEILVQGNCSDVTSSVIVNTEISSYRIIFIGNLSDLNRESMYSLSTYTNNATSILCEKVWEQRQGGCIKSHEANECELNNPDYVYSEEWIVFPEEEYGGELYEMQIMTGCPQTKTCRKKEIYDYSCEELKEAIHKQWNYCPSRNKFNVICSSSTTPRKSRRQLS